MIFDDSQSNCESSLSLLGRAEKFSARQVIETLLQQAEAARDRGDKKRGILLLEGVQMVFDVCCQSRTL